MPSASLTRRLGDGLTMLVVTGLSLLLLVYVGFGEAMRTYEQFDIEKIVAQGRIVQNSIENYLRAGLPLKQVSGVKSLLDPIVDIEEVDAIGVYDTSGKQILLSVDKTNPKLPELSSAVKRPPADMAIDQNDTHYQIVLPLRTRFETSGSIVAMIGKRYLERRVSERFVPLLYAVLGLSGLFAAVVWAAGPYLARTRAPWLQIGYSATFLVTAGLVVGTLISLYAEGAGDKAKAAAFTLSERLKDVVEFNLRFKDFDGLDRVFNDYRRLNPEISSATLVVDGIARIDTDATKIGKPWASDPRAYEYVVDMTRPNRPHYLLAVRLPTSIVYERVERSIRNFGALFIASAFLAGLFLQVAVVMQRMRKTGEPDSPMRPARGGAAALTTVKPVFFLAVFLENLTYSFLPKFMQETATASGLSVGFASAPFTAYYLCFALSLIPAGHLSDRYGPRRLIILGLILAGASVFGLVAPMGIAAVTVLRGLAGIGQGMLFIGVQAYILAVATEEKKTQGAAIIVFGFQGGMISGMAIGSLLVGHLHPQGIFVLSGAIGLATALYSAFLIPGDVVSRTGATSALAVLRRVGSDLRRVVHDPDFLRTMFCIGVPAKAILTGGITFALPLLLGQAGFRPEEIGQIIMLYGMGVIASSSYVSRLVDRTAKTDMVLFWGAALSGGGLLLVGQLGAVGGGGNLFETAVVVVGVVLVGIAHGFINAPVVTHVAHSELAREIGANPVTTTYRFLERAGHVAGPLLVGQLFLIWGQRPGVLGWIGVATASLGMLFLLFNASPRPGAIGPKVTS